MACCLLSAKPLSEPMEACGRLDLWKQFSVKFETILQYNEFEYVICKMAAILSRPQCVFVFVFVFDGLYLYLYLIRFSPVYLYLYLYLKFPRKIVFVFVFVFDKTYLTPALVCMYTGRPLSFVKTSPGCYEWDDRPTRLLDFLCVVLFHLLNNIAYRYICALGILLFLELVMKGRTIFSHVDVQVKSLFIENRVKTWKKN